MFYVAQMIDSRMVTPPKIFANQALAQEYFLALIREYRSVEYEQFCARHGVDPESFETAKAFAEGMQGENLCLHYWELPPDEDGCSTTENQPPPQSREEILRVATDTQQQILGIQAELRNLTTKLTSMSQGLTLLRNQLNDEGDEVHSDETPEETELTKPTQNTLDEKYQSDEWRDFVQSLVKMCGGNWSEFPLLSRHDWRQAVYSNDTTLPYWEWVAIAIDRSIEKAKEAGYTIEEDCTQSGHFAYLTPTGERSAILYEMEDLAWCAAGLHAEKSGNIPS